MSTNRPPSSTAQYTSILPSNSNGGERTEFQLQREELLVEVARSLDNVLANLNKLNRNLEQVTAVGHEFGSVEALWSRFEDVMVKNPEAAAAAAAAGNAQGGGQEGKEEGAQEGDITSS